MGGWAFWGGTELFPIPLGVAQPYFSFVTAEMLVFQLLHGWQDDVRVFFTAQ